MSGWGQEVTARGQAAPSHTSPTCPSRQNPVPQGACPSRQGSAAPVPPDTPVPLVKGSADPSPATRIIGAYGGYRRTLAFGYVCLVYHATTLFCKRNYDCKNDALGKTSGQMVGAARSARQNIVEGSSRAGTSKETELRLYDVAKGSLEELAGDYEAFLIDAGVSPWSENDPRVAELSALRLAKEVESPRCPECGGPMRRQVARRGRNAGNPFWSCCSYSNCTGTRRWEAVA